MTDETLFHKPAMIARSISKLVLAGLASVSLASAPALAHSDDDHGLTINGFSFENTEDLLEKLIELDADDIAELRDDMADAREDVLDAIGDVEEARAEARQIPGGGLIVKIAIGVAAKAVTEATEEIFVEVKSGLNDAEVKLADQRSEVGEAEFAETNEAISVIRNGLADIELALDELVAAMRDEA